MTFISVKRLYLRRSHLLKAHLYSVCHIIGLDVKCFRYRLYACRIKGTAYLEKMRFIFIWLRSRFKFRKKEATSSLYQVVYCILCCSIHIFASNLCVCQNRLRSLFTGNANRGSFLRLSGPSGQHFGISFVGLMSPVNAATMALLSSLTTAARSSTFVLISSANCNTQIPDDAAI